MLATTEDKHLQAQDSCTNTYGSIGSIGLIG